MPNILTGTIKRDVNKEKEDCSAGVRLLAETIKHELYEYSGMFVVSAKKNNF